MAAMADTAAAISPAPSHAIAITGGTILDMTARKPIADGTVVVVDGRITAVGPSGRVAIPRGATIVNAAGKTVMPGLWDMHAHFEQVEWGPIYLASGVTTIRDVGNELEFIVAARDAVAAGKGLGPRMLLAGIIDGPGSNGLGAVRAATPEEARQRVDRYHDAGFMQIKIYSSVSLDVLRAITAEAHRLGMTVTGHVPEGMNAFAAIDAGLDQINHAQYLTAVADSNPEPLIAALRKHKTVIDPTLALYELLARPTTQPIESFEPGIKKVARELETPLGGFGSSPEVAPMRRRQFDDEVALVGRLHRAGIPVVAGTDQSVPGHSLHRELELYVRAGFSPLEALQAATIVPATAMKTASDSGTIESGKLGDLIVLDGNPLDDIHNTRRIYRVITGGRVFDPAPLWRSVGFLP
jgi:imidazolonepropionase-like amidohydrolase